LKGLDPERPDLNIMNLASGLAIARDAQESVRNGAKTNLITFADGNNVQNISAKTVAMAAKAGDKAAQDIIRRAAKLVGLRIVKIIEEDYEKTLFWAAAL
jgi:predicted NBD/HSP70 family sugar kinase